MSLKFILCETRRENTLLVSCIIYFLLINALKEIVSSFISFSLFLFILLLVVPFCNFSGTFGVCYK